MNSDATEAALGLLGLSPLNAPQSHPQPQGHSHHHVAHAHGPSLTSSSVGVAIDRTSAPHIIQSALPPSVVPLKRKQPISPALSTTTTAPLAPSVSRDGLPTKLRHSAHLLATSSAPTIRSNHPLSNGSTKPSTTPAEQRSISPIHSSSVPPQIYSTSHPSLASPSTSQHPLSLSDAPPPPDSEAISCICGFTYDDGFSIACDDCLRWCHAACFGIIQGGEVPEFWKCWVCDPLLEVDRERAVKIQKGRLRAMRMKASHGTNGGAPGATTNGNSVVDEGNGGVGKPVSRRKASPGAERKSRRGSAVAAAIEGSSSSKKKRRASMLSPADSSSPSIPPSNHASSQLHPTTSRTLHLNGSGPTTSNSQPLTPVVFPPNIYPNPSVYAQLLRVAKAWRGVTALNPPSTHLHPPPKTYHDGGYTRVDSQGYQDSYGYFMPPLDNTTPVILDENAGDIFVPRTILRTDPSASSFTHSSLQSRCSPASTTCTPAHLRPPSPRLHVASDPSPFSHASIYPSPPISNYMSPPVPSSLHPRSCAKSPLTPSTNTVSSSNANDTIPATTLLAPYTATIVPSAAYLADPLNGYAHLGMGKPQVRLVGGGWGVGLDARGIGGVPPDSGEKGQGVIAGKEEDGDVKAIWARCGCWPNAVVRPVVCGGVKRREDKKEEGMRHSGECAKGSSDGSIVSRDGDPPRTMNGKSVPPLMSRVPGQQTDDSSDQDDGPSASDSDSDPTSLSFALFALRDLRADEEIVLGWEWDDGHAVHMLPALIESPGMFAFCILIGFSPTPHSMPSTAGVCHHSPAYLHHLRAQFTSILHALSSTFTTCACGSSTRDCAVRVMERVVEGQWPWPGGEMTPDGSEGDSSEVNGASEEWDDDEDKVDVEGDDYLGPRPSRNWGLGMNMDVDIEMDASAGTDTRIPQVKRRKPWKKNGMEGDASTAVPAAPPKLKTKKAIDLGPLVGVRRGFRTREKMPMNGGWGGVEIVPSSLYAFPEVRAGEDSRVSSKGKGKARVADDNYDSDVDPSLSTLPPRMRRPRSRTPVKQLDPPQENPPRDHWKRTESWRAHERWRSPPDANAESPTSASGIVEGSDSKWVGLQQASVSVSGDREDRADEQETEFDTETEADGSDDTRQMPPPPMPASLDPTTVSSPVHAHVMRSSSRGLIQWDKQSVSMTWIPPQTLAPMSAASGWPSQSPEQGMPTGVLALNPIIACPPASPQVDNGILSSSAPFPPVTEAQVQSYPPALAQSHPPSLVSSVSPSATFSKLSIHSPDVSSPAPPSVLFSPSESAPPLRRSSDHQTSSPPPHKPSEPLHMHAQKESFASPMSLAAPTLTGNSPGGMRDTPAEIQHQQTCRPSPESWHEINSPSNVEKRRPTNGEPYRVRFASPEILHGLPRLGGRTTSIGSEPSDTDKGATANADTTRAANEQEALLLNHDDMDIDLDIIGDDGGGDGNGRSCPAPLESRMNLPDEYSSLYASSSSRRLRPSDSLPHRSPDVAFGAALENNIPSLEADVNESMSQAEATTVEPVLVQATREPSPPPPPKVKMSLKDFALRKKKQREEEMAAKALRSPATPDDPGLSSSPGIEVKRELMSDNASIVQTVDSDSAPAHANVDDAAKEDTLDSSGSAHVNVNSHTGREHHILERTEEKNTGEDITLSAESQTLSMVEAAKVPNTTQSSPLLRSLIASSHILDNENNMEQTQMQSASQSPVMLTAKMEIMDAIVSSAVNPDDRMPGIVSCAPEPPPPPLATERTNETAIIPVCSTPGSGPPSTLASTSTPTSMSTSTSTSNANSRSNSVGTPVPIPSQSAQSHTHDSSSSSSIPSSCRPSHEDGEITSSTPPKAYLPRSHTPPTQPRSFHTVHPSSPGCGPTSSSTASVPRRPAPPHSRSPLSNPPGPAPTPTSSRPPPSGPRALRGSMTQSTHPPSYTSTRPLYTGSQYIPRGPSADRERIDWDRGDRQWAAQARSRGRAGSNGWGR